MPAQRISRSHVLPLAESTETAPNEKLQLIEAIRQASDNQTQAAKILNINRVTVWNRMKKYSIDIKKVMSV